LPVHDSFWGLKVFRLNRRELRGRHLRGLPVLLVMCAVLLAGCRHVPSIEETDAALAAIWQTGIERTPADSPRLPLPSPFDEMVDWAFATGEDGRPRHCLSLLETSEEALLSRLHLIHAAKESVDIQVFIWKADETGLLVGRELLKAARRGVQVRCLIDFIWPIDDPEGAAQLIGIHPNLQFRAYNPPRSTADTGRLRTLWEGIVRFWHRNQRMHNKLMVVDGGIGIVGGRNIDDHYFAWDDSLLFLDRDVVFIGPAARDAQDSFDAYWNSGLSLPVQHSRDIAKRIVDDDFEWGDVLDVQFPEALENMVVLARDANHVTRVLADHVFRTTGPVAYMSDPPGQPGAETVNRHELTPAYLRGLAAEAQEEVILQTPYLVASKEFRRQDPDEHPWVQGGVRTIAVTNSLAATNHREVYAVSYGQRRKLLRDFGMIVYELKPLPGDLHELFPGLSWPGSPWTAKTRELEAKGKRLAPRQQVCLHAKAVVIDHEIVYIGSHNFDPRSTDLDTQNGLLIKDRDVAEAVRQRIMLETAPRNSWVSAWKGRKCFLLSWLDIWPCWYATNYELRNPSSRPLLPSDAEFRERYEDVGAFPEVRHIGRRLVTLLLRRFGGWAAPVM
jgi:phosphatidylserine/phosphatidylglycerophosphate/cardiolipin synthase-like enzyme